MSQRSPLNGKRNPSLGNDGLQSAYEVAVKDLPLQREEIAAAKVVDSAVFAALAPIKEAVKSARKPKMRTVEHYLCDVCDGMIGEPEHGFIIQGNIYVADPAESGGLIGNNFPEPDENGKIDIEKINKTVMCKECLLKALGCNKGKNTRNKQTFDGILGHLEAVAKPSSRY